MEEQMIEYIEEKWKCKIVPTSTFCLIDGIVVQDNVIKGIIELKSRNSTYEQRVQFDTLLITFDKIKMGIDMSRMLSVPFYVAIKTSDDIYLYWEICNDGIPTIGMQLDYSETNKRTEINNDGSKAIRYNAFIKINQAKKI
jgi:hypothetical protein